MAIFLDNNASIAATSSTSPVTWSHRVNAGPKRMLVVLLAIQGGTQPTVTAVTFNSIALTKQRADQASTGSLGFNETSIWTLANPPIGNFTVSATATLGTLPDFAGASVSYFGVQGVDALNGATDSTVAGSHSVSVTTVADQCWVAAIGNYIDNGAGATTLTTGQTSRGTTSMSINLDGVYRAADTNAAVAAGTNQSMTFTAGGSSGGTLARFTATGISLAPVPDQLNYSRLNNMRPHVFSPGLAR